MKYQLVALDLDGTALSSNSEVQHSTIEAVHWAREQGVHVVVSTGRIVGEAADFALQMGTDDLMVTGGGAALGLASTRTCLERTSIPWEIAVRAAAILERANLFTMTYCAEQIFMTPHCNSLFSSYKKNEGFLSSKLVVPSVAEYIATNHLAVDKLFCRCPNPIILQNARRQLEQLKGVRVFSSAADNLEIVNPITNKAVALRKLAASFDTDLAHTIAIGDSENDLEMLQAVGMPVAMGNAAENVKAFAKYITADNNHGGVAQAIYELLGKEPS